MPIKRKIEKYDKTIRCAAEHGIDVSAVILVYPELWSRDLQVGRMLEHPEYKRCGAYTMPNLTNIDSVNLYAAALDFLAARYNRPDGKYGRIHRWIVHNEVNSGSVWTNAGNKTLVEFMDIYVKSMRMVYYTARKYDADAEVFISLDHCWNQEYTEPHCYPAAEVMDTLMAYCEAEGDFKWGAPFTLIRKVYSIPSLGSIKRLLIHSIRLMSHLKIWKYWMIGQTYGFYL